METFGPIIVLFIGGVTALAVWLAAAFLFGFVRAFARGELRTRTWPAGDGAFRYGSSPSARL